MVSLGHDDGSVTREALGGVGEGCGAQGQDACEQGAERDNEHAGASGAVGWPVPGFRQSVVNQWVDNPVARSLESCSTEWLTKGAKMADQLSRVFAALADPTRRDMVARLTEGDATVGQLAAPYAVSVQAVSKHLKVLEEAGLVTRGREAQRRPVHVEAEVFDLMTKWIERYRQRAEERYQRLDAVLAELDEEHTETPTKGTAS